MKTPRNLITESRNSMLEADVVLTMVDGRGFAEKGPNGKAQLWVPKDDISLHDHNPKSASLPWTCMRMGPILGLPRRLFVCCGVHAQTERAEGGRCG